MIMSFLTTRKPSPKGFLFTQVGVTGTRLNRWCMNTSPCVCDQTRNGKHWFNLRNAQREPDMCLGLGLDLK